MHLLKPTELCDTVNFNVNYGLQLLIMYRYWFIHSKKCTTLMLIMLIIEETVCRGTGANRTSVLSA